MSFIIFVIAWLTLLGIFISTKGKAEENPLAWLCLGVIFLAALYTMATISFMAGVGMIGSLAVFQVVKDKNGNQG
jgi:hypothetical protein